MFIKTVIDSHSPETRFSIQSLLLGLDEEIEFLLPNGNPSLGILREVEPLGNGRLIELIIEISDIYESLYYVNHSRGDINLVHREG